MLGNHTDWVGRVNIKLITESAGEGQGALSWSAMFVVISGRFVPIIIYCKVYICMKLHQRQHDLF